MSRISHWLKHKAVVKRLTSTNVDGAPVYDWMPVNSNLKCKLDLAFVRLGKDPTWSPQAGRQPDRNGVLFCEAGEDLRPGDRITMLTGPSGTFELDGVPDEPWDMHSPSHWELGVVEVAQSAIPSI